MFPGKKWHIQCKCMPVLYTHTLTPHTLPFIQPQTLVYKWCQRCCCFFLPCVSSSSILPRQLSLRRRSQRWRTRSKSLERHFKSNMGRTHSNLICGFMSLTSFKFCDSFLHLNTFQVYQCDSKTQESYKGGFGSACSCNSDDLWIYLVINLNKRSVDEFWWNAPTLPELAG